MANFTTLPQSLFTPSNQAPMTGQAAFPYPQQPPPQPTAPPTSPASTQGQPSPQQGQPPTGMTGQPPPHPFADDPDSMEADSRFDQFIDMEMQQAQSRGNQDNLGFLGTLRAAKSNDPEGFYMLLGAFASGNPDTVAQVAMNFRNQRLQAQEMQQRNLMSAMAQLERQQYQTQEATRRKAEQDVINVRQDLGKLGELDVYESEKGYIDTPEKAVAARQYLSERVRQEKVEKEKQTYLQRMVSAKRFIPPVGNIKKYADEDPDFANSLEAAKGSIEEGERAIKEVQAERLTRLQELNRLSKGVQDPRTRYEVQLQLIQLRDAIADANRWEEQEFLNGTFAEFSDTFSAAASDASNKRTMAQQRAADLDSAVRDLISGIGGNAPTVRPPTPSPSTTAPVEEPISPEELDAIRRNLSR